MLRKTVNAHILGLHSVREYEMPSHSVNIESMADNICMRPETHYHEIPDIHADSNDMTVLGYSYDADVMYSYRNVQYTANVHVGGVEKLPVPGKGKVKLLTKRSAPKLVLEVIPS